MKTKIEQEIKGTVEYIDLIASKIKERKEQGEHDGLFIRHCMRHLSDALAKLKRLTSEIQTQGLEF